MSEDMKPKKFWVYMGDHALLASSLPVSFNDGTHVYHVIELEPTMRLIKDMAVALRNIPDDIMIDNRDFYISGNVSEALEKYKKFKEGLK